MGEVEGDSDDIAPEDGARRTDPAKTISSLGWAEWKGAMSAHVKELRADFREHVKADAERFDCIDSQLEAGQQRFTDIEKTLSRYAGIAIALLLAIELTIAAMGVAASAGWFSRGP